MFLGESPPTGVYFGWASLEASAADSSGGAVAAASAAGPWKCVANVGYSPTFVGKENAEKIVEGHLIGYEGGVYHVQCSVVQPFRRAKMVSNRSARFSGVSFLFFSLSPLFVRGNAVVPTFRF